MSMELREEARKRENEKIAKRQEQEQAARDLRTVAALPEGARLLRRLLRHGDLFRPGYEAGTSGAYRAGKKAAALEVWRALKECLPQDDFVAIALAADDSREESADLPEEFIDTVQHDFY